jgi:hypothetical protein
MTKETKFKKELSELLEKYNVELEMNIDDGETGVESAKLVFHLRDDDDEYISTDNELHTFRYKSFDSLLNGYDS